MSKKKNREGSVDGSGQLLKHISCVAYTDTWDRPLPAFSGGNGEPGFPVNVLFLPINAPLQIFWLKLPYKENKT